MKYFITILIFVVILFNVASAGKHFKSFGGPAENLGKLIGGSVVNAMNKKGEYGCGKHGECWAWCSQGYYEGVEMIGWCYQDKTCSSKEDCNSDDACRKPRDCQSW